MKLRESEKPNVIAIKTSGARQYERFTAAQIEFLMSASLTVKDPDAWTQMFNDKFETNRTRGQIYGKVMSIKKKGMPVRFAKDENIVTTYKEPETFAQLASQAKVMISLGQNMLKFAEAGLKGQVKREQDLRALHKVKQIISEHESLLND